MKPMVMWILKKTGIYQNIWNEFCDKYPIRISAETPEVRDYLKVQEKVFIDMMVHGMGCTHYVDPKDIGMKKDVVMH